MSQPEADRHLPFIDRVLEQILEVEADRERVYEFWRDNLTEFDEDCLALLPGVLERLAEKYSLEAAAAISFAFADCIDEFPLGLHGLNLELAIAAYEWALEVYTCDTF